MKTLLSKIRLRISNLSNGPAMESMRKLGINYKTMHGLTLVEIKSIANDYLNNHELAIELWKCDDRELKILATLVADPKKISLSEIQNWAEDLKNSELAEQLAINLAFRTSFAEALIPQLFLSENAYAKKSALVLLAWAAQRSTNISEKFLKQQLVLLPTYINEDLQLAKGISFAFRGIGKRNLALNTVSIVVLNQLKENQSYNAKLIVDESLWELELDVIQDRLK